MPFTTRSVCVDLLDDRGTLIQPLGYQGKVDHFVVPSGFRTDFASVPQAFMWFAPAIGKYTQAAVLHDFFCWQLREGLPTVSPVDADGIFRRVMKEAGVGVVKRWAMWSAVRLGALWGHDAPRRRAGWWATAPAVAGITLAELAAVAAVLYGAHRLFDLIWS